MAINEVLQPGSTAPTNNNDYTYQNNNIDVGLIPKLSIFSNWEDTTIEPVIAQGTFIYMGGLIYECQTSNEAIAGTPSAGINYIVAAVTGSVMTLAWSTSKTGYTFNPQFGGNYSGSNQILLDICYKDGTAFRRARSLGMDLNNFYLANGSIWFSGGLITNNNPIDAGTGALTCGTIYSGGLITNNNPIDAGTGALTCGTIYSDTITASGGSFSGGLNGAKAIVGAVWGAGSTQDYVYNKLNPLLPVIGLKCSASGYYYSSHVYAVERQTSTSIRIYYYTASPNYYGYIEVFFGSSTTINAGFVHI